ncbi:hypothetical protein VTI74DRAFT_9776 [Chaetomium olivicolor]
MVIAGDPDQQNHHLQVQPTTFALPLRPQEGSTETMVSTAQTAIPPGLASPGISVEFHGDPEAKSALDCPRSAPANMQSFPSPMRHHRRTPSAHREIKETLNARSEYTSDDAEGRSQHRINQYVIKDEIGRGSYGAVYLATDQFGDEYAVKAFSKTRLRKRAQSEILRHGPRGFPRAGFGAPNTSVPSLSEQRAKEAKDALYLIREEVAIMKKLNHPNLVQLIEVLDDPEEDTLYMVMEMCKKGVVMKVGLGESATPYPEETCRYWFRDLILGIEYLHSQGVVHRDIKPENLLLTDDDVLKIVDFGVSEMFEKSDDMRTAKSAGSPAFLPPELCGKHGDVSGKAADIWSMGVSLYCLRYGRIPFERELLPEIYEAIKNDTPKLPPDENPDFVDLTARLLEKDPAKRITMDELREHPWVTKGGTDPLLSADENCSEPVEAPNPLELNHAFTRRMSHLICVMKAIRKFKSLLARPTIRRKFDPYRPITPLPSPRLRPTAVDPDHPHPPDSTAEFAARVLRERQEFLASGGKASIDQLLLQAHQDLGPSLSPTSASSSTSGASQHGQPTLLLGIGTGGIDDFTTAGEHADPAAGVVSDSPSVVDFNVYDRAFEQELERIRRSSSRKGGAAGRKGPVAGSGLGPTVVYGTRFSERSGLGGSGRIAGLRLAEKENERGSLKGLAGLMRDAAAAAAAAAPSAGGDGGQQQ